MSMGIMGSLSLALCAVLVWRFTVDAARGRYPRNGAMGLRTRGTNASDEAWLAGHQAAVEPARRLALLCCGLAIALFVAGLMHPGLDAAPSPVVLTLFVLGYTVFAVGAALVAWTADRAARTVIRG